MWVLRQLEIVLGTTTGRRQRNRDWILKRGGGSGGEFSPLYSVQAGSTAHPAFYPMGTTGIFLAVKAAGA
jgi:hypothetical protein